MDGRVNARDERIEREVQPELIHSFMEVPALWFSADPTQGLSADEQAAALAATVARDPRVPAAAKAAMYRLLGSAHVLEGYGVERIWAHAQWDPWRRAEEESQQLMRQLQNLDEDVGEGTFQCPEPNCRSRQTYSQGLQVRSSDEPMTYYVRCARGECPRALRMWVVRG